MQSSNHLKYPVVAMAGCIFQNDCSNISHLTYSFRILPLPHQEVESRSPCRKLRQAFVVVAKVTLCDFQGWFTEVTWFLAELLSGE